MTLQQSDTIFGTYVPSMWEPAKWKKVIGGEDPEDGYFAFPRPQDTQFVIPSLDAHFGSGSNMIVMLIGRRGEGKTAFMTAMLERQLQAFKRKNYPGRLFSNYNVKFFRQGDDGLPIDFYSPWLIEEIATFDPEFTKGYMAVDELQGMALNRRSMAGGNVNLGFFITQIRHRDIECIFTTQQPQVIDYQVLIQTDLFIRITTLRRYRNGFPMIVRLYIFDFWGHYTGKDHRKRWPPQMDDVDAIRDFVMPAHLAGSYDTKEIISSSYWDPTVRERIIQHERSRQGVSSEALEEMRPGKVIGTRQPAARRGLILPPGVQTVAPQARTLADVINLIPKSSVSGTLTPYFNLAIANASLNIHTLSGFVDAINMADLGVVANYYTPPNSEPRATFQRKGKTT